MSVKPILLQSSLIPWMTATLFASLIALSPSTFPIPKALHNSSLGLLAFWIVTMDSKTFSTSLTICSLGGTSTVVGSKI